MVEIVSVIVIVVILLSLAGLGYFTIYRLTQSASDNSDWTFHSVQKMEKSFDEVHKIISGLDKRLSDLETEIRLQKSDSSRLVEWLDKRDKQLEFISGEFVKAQKISERESKIIELGESLRLITKK